MTISREVSTTRSVRSRRARSSTAPGRAAAAAVLDWLERDPAAASSLAGALEPPPPFAPEPFDVRTPEPEPDLRDGQRDPDRIPGRGRGPRLRAGGARLHSRPADARPRPAALRRAHPGGARCRRLAARLGPDRRDGPAPHRHEPDRAHRSRGRVRCAKRRTAGVPPSPVTSTAGSSPCSTVSGTPGKAGALVILSTPVRFASGGRRVRGMAAGLRRGTARRCPRQRSGAARRGPGRVVITDALVRGWVLQPAGRTGFRGRRRPDRALRACPPLPSRLPRPRRSAGSTAPSIAMTRSPRTAPRSSTATATSCPDSGRRC